MEPAPHFTSQSYQGTGGGKPGNRPVQDQFGAFELFNCAAQSLIAYVWPFLRLASPAT